MRLDQSPSYEEKEAVAVDNLAIYLTQKNISSLKDEQETAEKAFLCSWLPLATGGVALLWTGSTDAVKIRPSWPVLNVVATFETVFFFLGPLSKMDMWINRMDSPNILSDMSGYNERDDKVDYVNINGPSTICAAKNY